MTGKPKKARVLPGEEGLTPQQRRDLERIREAKRKALRTGSRVDEIAAHCLECIGGRWKDVQECDNPGCPLKRHRMGRIDADATFDPELVQ